MFYEAVSVPERNPQCKTLSTTRDFTGFCSENEGHFSCEVSLTAITEFNITVTLKRTASLLPNSFSKKEL